MPLPSQKMASDSQKLLTLVIGSEVGHGPGQAAQRNSPKNRYSQCTDVHPEEGSWELLGHLGTRGLHLPPKPGDGAQGALDTDHQCPFLMKPI